MTRECMPTLPNDKTVLVTNGFEPLRLHIIKRLLEEGCRVRTTVSMANRAEWLDEVFKCFVESEQFERMVLPAEPPLRKRYWRQAVKGVDAIIHTPTIPNLDRKPVDDAWQESADSVTSILDAAELEPQIKAFVMTGNLGAVTPLVVETDTRVDAWDFNTREVIGAYEESGKPVPNYQMLFNSCHVRAEEALWSWMDEAKPHFKANVVVPSNIIGYNFATKYTTAWKHNWLWRLWKFGKSAPAVRGGGPCQAHWYIDVEDAALMHIACVFDDTIQHGERIQAWGCFREWNSAIEILQEREIEKARKELGEQFDKKAREAAEKRYPFVGEDGVRRGMIYTNLRRISEICTRWKDYPGWKQFEETVKECLDLFENGGDEKPEPPAPPRRPNPFVLPPGTNIDEYHNRWLYRDEPSPPPLETVRTW
ncbi:hypothetical protein MYCTH_106343 [Thermothelomyces thermophilus ATCC 42464]|uniref:NAD-dependent epimerase/dehydratase domain-containing protein n=1 Tax=Thermothelomyces thermophilus (strain ATCC 42464 / BCRC 31852 / DSM 1799) TaxID=573729 RepID=G2Q487_THET4|nr:uncharacterized protein MYCTH_106343 [Thermothelomyces thermophilus ATCC 42464]AEO54482.1 hypothetical protein MYCTH_106343 [Thermothelomyces thermophilus ATCC 42464]